MGEIITELRVTEAVKRELIVGHQQRMVRAAIAQENIGIASRRLGPAKPVEGLGQPIARIQADIYWAMRQKFGADCWKDPDFVKSYLDKNPGARVVTKPRKTTLIVDGRRGASKRPTPQAGTASSSTNVAHRATATGTIVVP